MNNLLWPAPAVNGAAQYQGNDTASCKGADVAVVDAGDHPMSVLKGVEDTNR